MKYDLQCFQTQAPDQRAAASRAAVSWPVQGGRGIQGDDGSPAHDRQATGAAKAAAGGAGAGKGNGRAVGPQTVAGSCTVAAVESSGRFPGGLAGAEAFGKP